MKTLGISGISRFRNGEYLQFMKMVIMTYEQYGAQVLLLGDRLKTLQSLTDEMDFVFQDTTAHDLTPELKSLDIRRLKALKGLKRSIESYRMMEEEEFYKSADVLFSNYVLHGNRIDRLSMPQKTACIDALLSDWNQKPALLEAANKLSLNTWLNRLTSFNTDFTDKFVGRNDTTNKSPQIKVKRLSMKEALAELIADTESYARIIKDNPNYVKIIERLNTLIAKYNLIVNSRSPEKRKDKPELQEESFTD